MANDTALAWEWKITPTDPTVTCPSTSNILGTFALVNVVVSILSIPFGNRYVMNKLTFGRFYKNRNGRTYYYSWILTVGFQLAANALIAWMFQNAPGYNADFTIAEVMLFYTVRPRMSWITLGFLGLIDLSQSSRKSRKSATSTEEEGDTPPGEDTSSLSTPNLTSVTDLQSTADEEDSPPGENTSSTTLRVRSVTDIHPTEDEEVPPPEESTFLSTLNVRSIIDLQPTDGVPRTLRRKQTVWKYLREHDEEDCPWMSAAITQAFSEGVLSSIALVVLVKVNLSFRDEHYPGAALMFFSSVAYFTVFVFLFVFFCCICSDRLFTTELISRRVIMYLALCVTLPTSFVASWVFWAGFVAFSGRSYCPPKLYVQGSIWASFSLIGIMLGVGSA